MKKGPELPIDDIKKGEKQSVYNSFKSELDIVLIFFPWYFYCFRVWADVFVES